MPDPYAIFCVVFVALLVASEVKAIIAERRWAMERRDLLRRVQAGSLAIYEAPTATAPAPAVWQPMQIERGEPDQELPAGAILEAQGDFGELIR